MNTAFLRKMSLLGAFLASSPSFAALAINDLNSRLTSLETQLDQISTETALGTFGAKGTAANPALDGYRTAFNVDLIYWHIYEGSTYNFTENIAIASGITPTIVEENVDAHKINFDWDFGFKASAYQGLPHDDWEVGADFTYFRTKGRSVQTEGFPLLIAPGHTDNSKSAILNTSIDWELNFYDLDVKLARNYFFSKFLALRPNVGLKTTWIRQHSHDSRNSANSNIDQDITTSSDASHRKNNFWGIGPEVGLDTKWYFNSSFSLYGSVSGAILWGDFDISINETLIDNAHILIPGGPAELNNHTTANPHRLVPTVAFDLGLSWEFNFSNAKNCLEFKLGYENQYWWRQNYISPGTLNTADDLGFHGGLFEVKLDF